MKHHGFIATALAALSLLLVQGCNTELEASTGAAADRTAPDLIVFNADVYTVDPEQPRVSAFAVTDRKFTALGDDATIRALAGPGTESIDAAGATVTPGFIDGHTHLLSGASRLEQRVNLENITDRGEWRRIVAEAVSEVEPGAWITGGWWDHQIGPDQSVPSRALLDDISPDNPVALHHVDGHSVLANSAALAAAGIDRDSTDPEGGSIAFDADGEPTGMLYETATALITDLPGYQEDRRVKDGLGKVMRLANSKGVTSVHDMGKDDALDLWLDELDRGRLNLRVWFGHYSRGEEETRPGVLIPSLVKKREEVREQVSRSPLVAERGPLLDLGYVKFFLDGVMSTRTALFKKPYADAPEWQATPVMPKERLFTLVKEAHAAHFPVAVHALGDLAVQWVLDAVEDSREERPADLLPDRIEHMEITADEDIPRFAKLGVAASMQPHHMACCTGNYVLDRAGPERVHNAFVWRRMLDADAKLVLGSDWPSDAFEFFFPLDQIADAAFREDTVPWNDVTTIDEGMTLDFEESLRAYTQSGADMTAWSNEIGSVTPGKWADFVLFDQKIQVPVQRSIRDRKVMATYLAGEKVYDGNDQ